MNSVNNQANSAVWLLFVKLSFVVSVLAMTAVIFFMQGDLMLKGYLALNSLFMVSSTIMLVKTLRDEYENQKTLEQNRQKSAD